MNKKKKIIYIGLMVIALVLVVSGLSYAYFTATANSEQQVVTSGVLELTYETGQDIQVEGMFPSEERDASLHKFTVKNTGTLEATYNISFIDIDLKKDSEDITARNLKWALYEADENYIEGTLVKNGSFSALSGYLTGNDELVIKTGLTLAPSTKQSYVLKIWLQEAGKPQDEEQNMNFSMKVQVDTLDREESVGKVSILRARDGSFSTENFYYYKSQITKIVFQDQLNPISDALRWDVSADRSGNCMAYLVSNGESTNATYTLYIQGNEVIYLSSGAYLFKEFGKLEVVEGLEYVDTSQVTDMSMMFYQCYNLTSLDVRGFDTSNVTDMYYMFRECKSLTDLDLSHFDTSQVTDMSWMFYECNNLVNLNLRGVDTSQVPDMSRMFAECNSLLSLDLSSFDTSQVTDMSWMFYGCNNLTTINLSSFDTSNVTNMLRMFEGCSNLTSLDLSSFNTSQVTDMARMFYDCKNLVNLNLSKADFTKVTSYDYILGNVPRTIEVLVKDVAAQTWLRAKLSGGTVTIA